MSGKLILVLAAGNWPEGPIPADLLAQADLTLAADGGWAEARARGVRVDRVVGDLDSLVRDEAALLRESGTPMDVFPRDKDRTDLEIAVDEALRLGARRVIVYGALGGKTDQTLANVFLLEKLERAGVEGELWGKDERALVIRGEKALPFALVGDVVSLLPLSERVEGVTTWGLRYALRGEALERASTRGVSNEVSELPAGVRVRAGTLVVLVRRPESVRGKPREAA